MIRALRWRAGMAAAAAAVTALSLGTTAAQASGQARQPAAPRFTLVAANRTVQLQAFGAKNRVFLDPGIWVGAARSAFRVDVTLPRYGGTKVATLVLRTSDGGTVRRRLPFGYIDGFNGLSRFVGLTVRDAHGNVVLTRQLTFCPDSFDPERFSGNGPF
jgi:hypothetical protein